MADNDVIAITIQADDRFSDAFDALIASLNEAGEAAQAAREALDGLPGLGLDAGALAGGGLGGAGGDAAGDTLAQAALGAAQQLDAMRDDAARYGDALAQAAAAQSDAADTLRLDSGLQDAQGDALSAHAEALNADRQWLDDQAAAIAGNIEATQAATEAQASVADTADRLILHGLIPSLSTALSGYDSFIAQYQRSQNAGGGFADVFGNMGDMLGVSGEAAAGGAGAALALLMQNPEMQLLVRTLNSELQALITPIASALAPAFAALAPVLTALEPTMEIIGQALKTELQPLVIELNLVAGALNELNKLVQPLNDAITQLGTDIQEWNPFGGGGGGNQYINLPGGGKLSFDTGGLITPQDMIGYDPATGAGLIVAHAGETVVPKGAQAPSAAAVFNIQIAAMNAQDVATQLRALLEELAMTGRLGVA